jgi:hypothetical protein
MESKLAVISQSKTQEPSASDALVRERLFRFGVNFEKDVAPVLPLWLEAFGGMKPETLEPLFRKALNACKFFPKIADILEHVEHAKENASEEEAAQKWTWVLEYIRLHWNPDIPPRNAPRISERTGRAIRAAGGFAYIADCDLESKQWARKRFIESYVRYGELQQEQYLLPDGELRNLLADVAQTKALPSSATTFEELHQRGLAYAKQIGAPKPRIVPNAKPEPSRVVDVEGRRKELARQAEIIAQRYPETPEAQPCN